MSSIFNIAVDPVFLKHSFAVGVFVLMFADSFIEIEYRTALTFTRALSKIGVMEMSEAREMAIGHARYVSISRHLMRACCVFLAAASLFQGTWQFPTAIGFLAIHILGVFLLKHYRRELGERFADRDMLPLYRRLLADKGDMCVH